MITLRDNETVEVVIRKHWFALFRQVFPLAVLALLPLIVLPFFSIPEANQFTTALETVSSTYLLIFFGSLWLLMLWIGYGLFGTDHYLDVWYVTDQRIIGIEQNGLFDREISNLSYDRVQDVTVEVSGLIATLLNFGDLHVQSAGTKREFVIKMVPTPEFYKEEIAHLRELASGNFSHDAA